MSEPLRLRSKCGRNPAPQNAKPQTAPDQLSEGEKAIFTAITSMTVKDTELDLTSIRVLQIGNLEVRTNQDPNTILYGPDTVVVNLQGSNESGGTESAVSLAESEKRTIESANSIGDTFTVQQSKHDLMRYEEKTETMPCTLTPSQQTTPARMTSARSTAPWKSIGKKKAFDPFITPISNSP